ncbi:hypothetical protein QFC21_007311 [Naganishia friedmannii]|uniref:Uncharacterized protein n=1 Tax=Naganishia friedmannii TaxID=89922 RepID=A0ACC2UXF7_9TREE|nr:hypothetical protein QFC21_007311 [Naganishia friedmannii]
MWTRRVILALNALQQEYIHWPSNEEKQQIKTRFGRNSVFGHCIGIADGSLFPLALKPALRDDYVFFSRKHNYSITTLFTCDDTRRISFMSIGWGGSTYDSRVYKGTDPLANPSHESPEHEGRPREFESERAQNRFIVEDWRTEPRTPSMPYYWSDCDEISPPAKKRNKGPDKKHAKTSKIIEDTVTTADEAMLSKVDKMREEAVQAMKMKNKLAYEKEKDRKQDELRKREVAAREKEVALQVAAARKIQRDEFMRLCRKFPQDWDRAGRLAYGDKITWEELRDDMLAYAEGDPSISTFIDGCRGQLGLN